MAALVCVCGFTGSPVAMAVHLDKTGHDYARCTACENAVTAPMIHRHD